MVAGCGWHVEGRERKGHSFGAKAELERERERVVERLVTCRERTKTVTECLKKF